MNTFGILLLIALGAFIMGKMMDLLFKKLFPSYRKKPTMLDAKIDEKEKYLDGRVVALQNIIKEFMEQDVELLDLADAAMDDPTRMAMAIEALKKSNKSQLESMKRLELAIRDLEFQRNTSRMLLSPDTNFVV